jgi:predicted transglutaminase-like cysteine proteinase
MSGALARRLLLICSFIYVVFCAAELDPNKLQTTMQNRYGASGLAKFTSWQQLVRENRDRPDTTKIRAANDFFNKNTTFVDDIVHWKQSDYWATPLETLGTGAGDCEDYTIAKYATLLEMGVPMERLRLIYVKAQIGGPGSRVFQAHMVLGYYEQPNAIPLILDSLVTDIESAEARSDLHPVFSFNGAGLWVGNQAQPQIDPTARLSRWRDLLDRMKQEGF